MPPPRRTPAPSSLVLVLLLAALAVGGAASIVAAARTASSPPIPGTPVSEVYVSDQVIILGCVLLFLAIVVPLAYDRIRGGTSLPGRAVAVSLVVVLAMIIFVVAARFLGFGGSPFAPGTGQIGVSNNSSDTHTNLNNSTGQLLGNGGTISVWGLHFPAWVLFPVIAILGTVIAVVAVPRVRLYLQDRAVSRAGADSQETEVRGALDAAAQELASGSDPRTVILRLYGRLLRRVEPVTGNVDRATPEEIRTIHLLRLGIRVEAADALTRLFEEARYSTHPLGVDAATRASQAIADAERDLARDSPLP
jgi:hypothetical protein